MKTSNPAILALALAAMLAVTACAAPTGQDSPAIASRSDAWEKAFQAGEVDAIVALYTDDARILPPNAGMGRGHDMLRDTFGGLIDAGLSLELDTLEAVAAGDVGYNVGTYVMTAAGGRTVDRGKFIETWRLVDGVWKITNDTFNSDLPAGGAGTAVIAVHEVKDPAAWLAAWRGEHNRRELFAQNGVPSARVFQSPDDPKLTGLLLQVEDMKAMQSMLKSSEGVTAATEDGVKLPTLRMLTEVK